MKKRNPQADSALITAAVQLLIDRLIFVKVLSDREIEADYLTQLAEQVENPARPPTMPVGLTLAEIFSKS
jgi:hypothetical protein